jgi:prepilin peptidase CpaA
MSLQPQHAVTLVCAASAAILDYRSGSIPNRLILGGLGATLIAVAATGAAVSGWSGAGVRLAIAALGLLVCAAVPFALFLVRAMGGGDVKLLALCGAGLGPLLGMEAELYAFTLGALFGLARCAYDGTLIEVLSGSALLITNPILPKRMRKQVAPSALRKLRFGPAVAAGVVAALALHGSAP